MSAAIRFPNRRAASVWLTREGPAWLVLAGDHGWVHGDHAAAVADAEWLSENLGFAVRHAGAAGDQMVLPW
jgi:hypothetical protein